MQAAQFFDSTLLKKYNSNGPRYTSYPTALEFHDRFSHEDLLPMPSKLASKPLILI